ncbi:hypothetical protein DIPPA_31273 [Diplonema papillatum]|nr:hypothetical protein DIPPA_31273 [Diplonema papillatum]KAJ9455067.1 hypothetical protein DIPPA_31273 [Diplonema papillatum]
MPCTEVGSLVALKYAPHVVVGPVLSIEDKVATISNSKTHSTTSANVDDVLVVYQHYVAVNWDFSPEQACNLRAEPSMVAPKIGVRGNGDRELIVREQNGFLQLHSGGWVRQKGNFCGEWAPEGPAVSPEDASKQLLANGSYANSEFDIAEKAAFMKREFLKGTDIDCALAMALVARPPRQDHVPKVVVANGGDGEMRLGLPELVTEGEPEAVPSPTSSPARNSAKGRVRIVTSDMTAHHHQHSPAHSAQNGGGGDSARDAAHHHQPGQMPTTAWAAKGGGRAGARKKPAAKKSVKRSSSAPRAASPPPPRKSSQPLDSSFLEWLRFHSLSAYRHVFEKHEIDLDVLPTLTYADLAEMQLPAHVCKQVNHALNHPDHPAPVRRQRSPVRKRVK